MLWIGLTIALLIGGGSILWSMAQGDRVDRVVRCDSGHLYSSIWIPGVSLKAMRLGGVRYQYCPVGRHFARVTRLDSSEVQSLSDRDRTLALSTHDIRLP